MGNLSKHIRVSKEFYKYIQENRLYPEESINSILERMTGFKV